MRISIEWFLLDNTLMNLCVLLLAAALSGLRIRLSLAIGLSFIGGVFALLSLWLFPVLLTPVPKLLFACVLAFGLRADGWRAYVRGLLCVLLCALLLGGLMLLLTSLLGQGEVSGFKNGALVGTVETRAALLAITLAALMPRILRALRNAARTGSLHVPLRFTLDGAELEIDALIDTGNLLNEPVTGLPVVLVCATAGMTKQAEGYPVRYCGVNGEGFLYARRAQSAKICIDGTWHSTDIMVARSPVPISGAKAIVGNNALPPESIYKRNNREEVHRA